MVVGALLSNAGKYVKIVRPAEFNEIGPAKEMEITSRDRDSEAQSIFSDWGNLVGKIT